MSGKTRRPGDGESADRESSRRRLRGRRAQSLAHWPLAWPLLGVMPPARSAHAGSAISHHRSSTQPYFACAPRDAARALPPDRRPHPRPAPQRSGERPGRSRRAPSSKPARLSAAAASKAATRPKTCAKPTTCRLHHRRQRPDGRDRGRPRRPQRRSRHERLPLALRDLAVHDRERMLPQGQPVRRLGRRRARAPNGPKRSRWTSTWSRRSAPTATSCSSRPTPQSSENLAARGGTRRSRWGRPRSATASARPSAPKPRSCRAYDHPGIPITVAAGDEGYGVEVPADNPHVIAVGGTTLVPESNTRGWKETVWYGRRRRTKSRVRQRLQQRTEAGVADRHRLRLPDEQRHRGRGRPEHPRVRLRQLLKDTRIAVDARGRHERRRPDRRGGDGAQRTATRASFDGAHALYIDSRSDRRTPSTTSSSGKRRHLRRQLSLRSQGGLRRPDRPGNPRRRRRKSRRPVPSTEPASAVGSSEATLNATVDPNGAEISQCRFEYGTLDLVRLEHVPCAEIARLRRQPGVPSRRHLSGLNRRDPVPLPHHDLLPGRRSPAAAATGPSRRRGHAASPPSAVTEAASDVGQPPPRSTAKSIPTGSPSPRACSNTGLSTSL